MTDPNYKEATWTLRRRAAAATTLPAAAPSDNAAPGNRFSFTREQLERFAQDSTRLREKLSLNHARP